MSITKAEAEEFRSYFANTSDSAFFKIFKRNDLLKIIERETERELVSGTEWAEVAADALRSGEYVQAIYLITENVKNEDSRMLKQMLQSLGMVNHLSDKPCLNPTRPGAWPTYNGKPARCAKTAKNDVTYMCFTCWARHITYGPYCDKCDINHRGDC